MNGQTGKELPVDQGIFLFNGPRYEPGVEAFRRGGQADTQAHHSRSLCVPCSRSPRTPAGHVSSHAVFDVIETPPSAPAVDPAEAFDYVSIGRHVAVPTRRPRRPSTCELARKSRRTRLADAAARAGPFMGHLLARRRRSTCRSGRPVPGDDEGGGGPPPTDEEVERAIVRERRVFSEAADGDAHERKARARFLHDARGTRRLDGADAHRRRLSDTPIRTKDCQRQQSAAFDQPGRGRSGSSCTHSPSRGVRREDGSSRVMRARATGRCARVSSPRRARGQRQAGGQAGDADRELAVRDLNDPMGVPYSEHERTRLRLCVARVNDRFLASLMLEGRERNTGNVMAQPRPT